MTKTPPLRASADLLDLQAAPREGGEEEEEEKEEFFNHYKNNLKRHARTPEEESV